MVHRETGRSPWLAARLSSTCDGAQGNRQVPMVGGMALPVVVPKETGFPTARCTPLPGRPVVPHCWHTALSQTLARSVGSAPGTERRPAAVNNRQKQHLSPNKPRQQGKHTCWIQSDTLLTTSHTCLHDLTSYRHSGLVLDIGQGLLRTG